MSWQLRGATCAQSASLCLPACTAGYEPTSMRAIRARYNPYVQARARVDQLRRLGHSVDKVKSRPTAHSARSLALKVNTVLPDTCKCAHPLTLATTASYPRPPPPPWQVEFILMGGTFMSLPTDYRDYFVRNLHDALSGHSSKDVAEAVR